MADISRNGHRQRVKQTFIDSKDSLPDHNLLELLLFYSIPRKDVKPIAYNLINHFGSLEAIFNASIDELIQVDGVGESTAILISASKTINDRILINKNNSITTLDNYHETIKYVDNILKSACVEKFLMITLNNKSDIIKTHIISTGDVNYALVDPCEVVKYAIRDKASAVIIAHNHPKGSWEPSGQDINLTINILHLLRSFHIYLNDHIVVGEDKTVSLRNTIAYSKYFEDKNILSTDDIKK